MATNLASRSLFQDGADNPDPTVRFCTVSEYFLPVITRGSQYLFGTSKIQSCRVSGQNHRTHQLHIFFEC